jgi:hypothetical protein
MVKNVFIFSLIVACAFQWFIFAKLNTADFSVWAKQAEYVQTKNPAQFDFLLAYGHPGGPIIEAVIFLHNTFGLPYENSLLIFIVVLDGLTIAGASAICYALSKNNLWWPIVLVTLSANWLYISSTPPSTIVSLLIAFLCLFSLCIYKKEKMKPSFLVFWSILAGFIIATRVDIGVVMTLAFFIFLKPKLSWRQIFWMMLGIVVSFILFDPFMWFMPIRHIGDILFKIIYLYGYFAPNRLSFSQVLTISVFTFVSMFFSIIFLFMKEKIESPLPLKLIYVLLIVTAALYTVFLTAQCQATRYFLPLTNIWEVFLPLFIFSLTKNLRPTFSSVANIFFIVILILYPLSSLISSILIDKSYGLPF